MLRAVPGHRRHFCLSHWLFVKLYSLKFHPISMDSFILSAEEMPATSAPLWMC